MKTVTIIVECHDDTAESLVGQLHDLVDADDWTGMAVDMSPESGLGGSFTRHAVRPLAVGVEDA